MCCGFAFDIIWIKVDRAGWLMIKSLVVELHKLLVEFTVMLFDLLLVLSVNFFELPWEISQALITLLECLNTKNKSVVIVS